MSPEEYMQGIKTGTLPRYDKVGTEIRETISEPFAYGTMGPPMTEMQGDQPVRRVPRYTGSWEHCQLNLCQHNQECSYTPCRGVLTGVNRAVHNSLPPLDDVGSDVQYMLDENDPNKRPPAYHLLTRAADIVSGDRHVQHGPKERNHANIATLWRAYMSLKYANEGEDSLFELTAFDVATMMELLKIARRAGPGRTNPDNYVDSAGYSAIAGEIALNEGSEFPRKRQPGENPSS